MLNYEAFTGRLWSLSRESSLTCYTYYEWDLGLHGIIRRTALFSRLLRQDLSTEDMFKSGLIARRVNNIKIQNLSTFDTEFSTASAIATLLSKNRQQHKRQN